MTDLIATCLIVAGVVAGIVIAHCIGKRHTPRCDWADWWDQQDGENQ